MKIWRESRNKHTHTQVFWSFGQSNTCKRTFLLGYFYWLYIWKRFNTRVLGTGLRFHQFWAEPLQSWVITGRCCRELVEYDRPTLLKVKGKSAIFFNQLFLVPNQFTFGRNAQNKNSPCKIPPCDATVTLQLPLWKWKYLPCNDFVRGTKPFSQLMSLNNYGYVAQTGPPPSHFMPLQAQPLPLTCRK